MEAMASHRPYRPALGLERALAELEECAGRTLDADAVAACLRLFREKGYALPAVDWGHSRVDPARAAGAAYGNAPPAPALHPVA